MSRRFRDLPLQRKLVVVAMASAGLALTVACAVLAVLDQRAIRAGLVSDLTTTARILGHNTASALAFRDPVSAGQTLESLAAQPNIDAGALYLPDGTLFALYRREGEAPLFPAAAPAPRVEFSSGRLELVARMEHAGEFSGTVLLRSDLHALQDQLLRSLGVYALVLAGGGLLAYLVVSRIQSLVSRPILELEAVTARVAAEGDYSARATKLGDDEVGRLIDGFNAMLAQIQARDAALHAAQGQLEQRVAERTRALAASVALLNATLDSATDGIVALDKSGALMCSNARFRAMWRLSEELAARGSAAEIFQEIARQTRDPEAFLRIVRETNRGSLESSFHIVELANGQVFERFTHLQLIEGREAGVVVSYRDVTARLRAEAEILRERARFKFIFEAVPVGICYQAPGAGEQPIVNEAHRRIAGEAAADSAPPAEAELAARFARGELPAYSTERRYLHPDGREVWTVLESRSFTDPATGERQALTTLVDITPRKQAEAALAATHKQLLEISRQAGMAEVATGVLHNVGNVLNSVNVSATLLLELSRRSKIDRVAKLSGLFQENEARLPEFFATDPRAAQIPGFLASLAAQLGREQADALRELSSLRKNIEHIKEIVAMQQDYAKVSGVAETLPLEELVEDAIRMNAAALARHAVALEKDFAARPLVTTEKHKVLQILVNLMSNAKYACSESRRPDKKVRVRITEREGRAQIEVIDNGVGIAGENLTRIFAHGFTTKRTGHGFGLHSGAIAARELGGSLEAFSDGVGCGARFVLALPTHRAAEAN